MKFETQISSKKIKGASDIGIFDDEASSTKLDVQKNTDENFTGQNEKYSSAPKGLTPPIDGEYFTVKRSYAMRPSTVRKLNALKIEHPDVNVLFNTIIDMAINHYHNYIFNESGAFDN